MELGGFEPPTSWVRFRLLVAEEFCRRYVARRDKWLDDAESVVLSVRLKSGVAAEWESDYGWICGDCRRFRHKSVFVPDCGDPGYKSCHRAGDPLHSATLRLLTATALLAGLDEAFRDFLKFIQRPARVWFGSHPLLAWSPWLAPMPCGRRGKASGSKVVQSPADSRLGHG
jgi:hypothetical protein